LNNKWWIEKYKNEIVTRQKLRSEVVARLAILESADLELNVKQTLYVKLYGILLNYHSSMAIDYLYWYLKTLRELHAAGKISDELYTKLFIDPRIIMNF
jgi:hypothetical protein